MRPARWVNLAAVASNPLTPALTRALTAAAVLGVASTVGDWIWARYVPDGSILAGIVHGALIFALLAVVLAWTAQAAGALRRLLATLPAVGLLLAAAFYPLAALIGYLGALLVTWVGMWIALALLSEWARGEGVVLSGALARGLLAAVGSGLAFWAVSGMWTDPGFQPGLGVRFLYWSFAFLPGFVFLLAARR